jgi:flagellar biosynthesis/type III secretory pathway protein FliH
MSYLRVMPEFVTLAAWLRPVPAPEEPAQEPEEELTASPPEVSPEEEAIADVLSGVRRFRAMLADALDRALLDLLRDIAVEVVGRELAYGAADLQSIVARALERAAPERPLAVYVHPTQRDLVQLDVPVIGDPQLRSDDVRIELHSGSIDARLGVRIEQVLAAFGG